MSLLHRPLRAGAIAVLGLAITAMTGSLAMTAATAAPAATPTFSALKDSVPATTDAVTGRYSSARMTVEVALAPRDAAGLSRALTAAYTQGSASYHRWLAKGAFDAQYAPSAAQRTAVTSYLRGAGLTVSAGSSPFLVRVTGSSHRVAAAFRTNLSTYRDKRGVGYYSNSSAVRMPTALASSVLGVIGLTNTIRAHTNLQRPAHTRPVTTHAASATAKPGTAASCEAPYPTRAQLFAAVNDGTSFPFGFGGAPGCNGLTPSQTNSIYNAPHVGARGEGAGVTIAVFELSAYQHSDIDAYAHHYFGARYNPPLVDVNVDGGPLHPVCPTGDLCPPAFESYAGDIEVDADIETQLAVAPDVRKLIVYNAPNDETGQTELDEYTKIASDDSASSISSSWGECENDLTASYAQAENTVFEQMALQGQSVFGAAGDTGAFDCIRSDGTDVVNVNDPPAQPWMTAVGGTSLENANPGENPNPGYPQGAETVWNTDNLCSNAPASPALGGQSGFFWCGATGAGGGGVSQYWGRPVYQRGFGVTGTQRAVPDISADADAYTPYSEFCTATAATTNSQCAFSATQNVPGWFGIGGTSLSSPLWSAIIADRDSFQGRRTGNANPLLYLLYNLAPHLYFHDILSSPKATGNGLYVTKPGYDEATGIGSPNMAALITLTF
jgi:subtilase family serine protease